MKTTTTTTTTTHLKLATSWLDRMQIPPALVVAVLVLIAAAGISAVSRIRIEQSAPAAPTPALSTSGPIVVIQKESAPTPIAPTPDPAVYAELAALRSRIAELEQQAAAPPPDPVVVEQPIYIAVQQPEQAAPTAQEPPPPPQPTLAPQQLVLIDRNAWAAQAAAQP